MPLRSLVAGTAAVTLVLGGASAAMAEGSFSTSITQAQPTFQSRTWTDNNVDAVRTKVTLSNCKANVGGQAPGTLTLSNVEITLFRNGAAVSTKSQKCGTYDFGLVGKGDFYFKITSINGNTAANRNTFVNANPVSIQY